MPKRPDVTVENHGSIILLRPHTEEARLWLISSVDSDAQFLGKAIAVEPRYAGAIIDGMIDDGFLVLA